jgi:hypothetical protein
MPDKIPSEGRSFRDEEKKPKDTLFEMDDLEAGQLLQGARLANSNHPGVVFFDEVLAVLGDETSTTGNDPEKD